MDQDVELSTLQRENMIDEYVRKALPKTKDRT